MSSTLSSYEPATGALLWEGEASDIAVEVAAAKGAAYAWASLPLVNRIETMRRFANNVRGHETKFADLIARETGRPLWDAKAEVQALTMSIDLAVGAISERAGSRRIEGTMGTRHSLRHRPLGVMGVISPACMPAKIAADQILAALVAGNGVVFKPSEMTPATGQSLVDLMHGAGVPEALLRCALGGPDTGAELVAHDEIDGILFTGGSLTGLSISRALASRPDKLLSLNMGGNNAIIVWDVADIASAAALIVQSAFASTGQHCLAARRIIVREPVADTLIAEIARLTDQLIIDHPHADETPYMGPLLDMEAADRLTDSFLYLMSNGGKPIRHMRRPIDGLPFVTPGIIDVTDMAKRPDVEHFGPLLQIIRVADFEEAIALANDTRYGLSAALIGGTPEHFDYFLALSKSGIVNWNRPTTATPLAAPLGGTGLSGNHRPGGTYAADACAYPVVSAAIDQPRAVIGMGLRQPAPHPSANAA
jgi:succinylglutamic semialdehyde dehydrogenase